MEQLCAMTLSNLRECQLSAFDVEGVLQHDGGCRKNFNRKKIENSEAEDFTPIKHFIGKVAKSGLTVPLKDHSCSSSIIQTPKFN